MQIKIHYHDQSSEVINSSPMDEPCTRDNIRRLLRRRGCQRLEFVDETGKVVLSLNGGDGSPHSAIALK
jgi:hypothetical protein